MADEADLSKKVGLTPGKTVLIGALAVILVGVIYIQFGSDKGDAVAFEAEETIESPSAPEPQLPSPDSKSATVSGTAASDTTGLATAVPLASSNPEVWKAPDVASIVAYDPFALPPAFPQPVNSLKGQGLTSEGIVAADAATRASQLADEVAKLQSDLDSLKSRGVSVIIREHDQYVAMIGDRTLHVGDEIEGFTVTAIEPDGVRVEKKVQQ